MCIRDSRMDDSAVRHLLGLPSSTRLAPAICSIWGAPASAERHEFICWTEKVMNKGWKPSQRDFLSNWGCHLTVADSAPGSGKTTLIMAICLQVLRHSEPCRIFIAQPNKALCGELVDRLVRLALQAKLFPEITRVGIKEADDHWGTDHLQDYVMGQVEQKLKIDNKLLEAVDTTLDFLMKAYLNAGFADAADLSDAVLKARATIRDAVQSFGSSPCVSQRRAVREDRRMQE